MGETSDIVQDIQHVITREFIQFGQLTVYQKLYQAGDDGATTLELAEAIRGGDSVSLRGVFGALGNRINQTERFREKRPGIKLFFELGQVGRVRHYRMRPALREAIEGLPGVHRAVQWPLEKILQTYDEQWWPNPKSQSEQLEL